MNSSTASQRRNPLLAILVIVVLTLPDAWAVEIVRGGSHTAGKVSDISIAGTEDNLMTLVRTKSGNLKAILWSVTATGDIIRRGSDKGGFVKKSPHNFWYANPISLSYCCYTNARHFIGAVTTGSGKLKLIAWKVDGDQPVRFAELQTSLAGECVVAASPSLSHIDPLTNIHSTMFVTYCPGEEGSLLHSWYIGADDKIRRLDFKLTRGVGHRHIMIPYYIHQPPAPWLAPIVLAYAATNGNLGFELWDVDELGYLTHRETRSESPYFTALSLELGAVGDGAGFVMSYLGGPGGKVLTSYEIWYPPTIVPYKKHTVGGFPAKTATSKDVLERYIVASMPYPEHTLRLEVYHVDGNLLTHTETTGKIRDLAMLRAGYWHVTAIQTWSERLKLIAWDVVW